MTNAWKTYIKRFMFISCFCISIIFLLSVMLGPWSSRFIMSPREYMLMTHYLSSSIANYNTFGKKGTQEWLCTILKNDGLKMLFVIENGDFISCHKPNKLMLKLKDYVITKNIKLSVLKKNGYLIVNNNSSNIDKNYWIISPSSKISWVTDYQKPIVSRLIAGLILAFMILFISVWFISIPILRLKRSFKKVSKGQFNERIDKDRKPFLSDFHDLNKEFNTMGESIETFINLKDDVLEVISHELKSPLARQRAAMNILKEQTKKENLKYLERIQLENVTITDIIHDTLDYIKLHRENRGLKDNYFELIGIAKEVIENATFQFGEKKYKLNAPKQCFFRGDLSLIKVVLENIILNASKHSPNEDEITVIVTDENSNIKIIVKDRGPGVKEENINKIFEPYFSESQTSFNIRNHGLGLAITKKIISLHHGTIFAKNRRNGGLSMTVILPTS